MASLKYIRLVILAVIISAFALPVSAGNSRGGRQNKNYRRLAQNNNIDNSIEKDSTRASEEGEDYHSERGDSEKARSRKTLGFAGQVGLMAGGLAGVGVNTTYNVSPRFQIGGAYMTGSIDLASSVPTYLYTKVDKVYLSAQSAEIFGKYFFGNSFAMSGGLLYRKIYADIKVSSTTSNDSIRVQAEGTALASKLAIGNYWSWNSGFNLGCEWVGVSVPMTSDYSSSTQQTGLATSDLKSVKASAEDLAKVLAKSNTIHLLNLSVGFSF